MIGKYICTVKHAIEVTSIKQLPVLKGHFFLIMSKSNSYEFSDNRNFLTIMEAGGLVP